MQRMCPHSCAREDVQRPPFVLRCRPPLPVPLLPVIEQPHVRRVMDGRPVGTDEGRRGRRDSLPSRTERLCEGRRLFNRGVVLLQCDGPAVAQCEKLNSLLVPEPSLRARLVPEGVMTVGALDLDACLTGPIAWAGVYGKRFRAVWTYNFHAIPRLPLSLSRTRCFSSGYYTLRFVLRPLCHILARLPLRSLPLAGQRSSPTRRMRINCGTTPW